VQEGQDVRRLGGLLLAKSNSPPMTLYRGVAWATSFAAAVQALIDDKPLYWL